MLQRYSKIESLAAYIKQKRCDLAEANQDRDVTNNPADARCLTNVGTFRAFIVEYLRSHPRINSDMLLLVRQLPPTQFGLPIDWPAESIPPTTTYESRLRLRVGGQDLWLFHARGETDDHTWVYLPNERVIYTGDLFIWAVPNAGNPQKVQRYCIEWAWALREMAALEPQVLLPGHGLPIEGEDRVRTALLDTAAYLESLYRQTVALMNEGATIDDIIHTVRPPAELAAKPYLQPVYDEPEFIVRNVYRCLGGWYGGVPSELKPAPTSERAREIAALAGGIAPLLGRARELAGQGNFRMACHLVDWAADAAPESGEVHTLRAEVYEQRAEAEPSTMSRGIYGDAARRARERATGNAQGS